MSFRVKFVAFVLKVIGNYYLPGLVKYCCNVKFAT